MSLTERERHDAYEALQETFGPRTDIVIAMLQPGTNLVTKDDLAVTDAALRRDMAEMREGLRTEMADLRTELRTEMAGLRTELRTEMAGLRTELHTDMADLRTDVRTDIAGLEVSLTQRFTEGIQHQTRTMIFTIMGAVVLLLLAEALRGLVG